jgi:cell division protein FtsW
LTHKRSVVFILFSAICINGVGILALVSVNPAIARGAFIQKQVLATVLSWISCVGFALVPLSFFFRCRRQLLVLAFFALSLVLIPGIGYVVNGSRRWIQIPGFSLQVSEFSKIPIIIWLAGYIYENNEQRKTLIQGLLWPIFVCGSLAFLILCEPDYGTTFLIMVVTLLVLFLMGSHLRHIIFLFLVGGVAFLGMIALNANRLRRLVTFFSAEECRFGATYQLWQGMLCFASGGLWGSGVGLGRQKLSYLPKMHTDFMFSIIGEEFGGVFSIAVIVVFLSLTVITLIVLYQKTDIFIQALGFGAIFIIALQTLINIGVVTGCLPTKGIALPFISYGGSNLVTMYSLIGLIINCLRSESLERVESWKLYRNSDHKRISSEIFQF